MKLGNSLTDAYPLLDPDPELHRGGDATMAGMTNIEPTLTPSAENNTGVDLFAEVRDLLIGFPVGAPT